MKYIIYLLIVLLGSTLTIHAQGNLNRSWTKQNRPLRNKVLTFSFTESRNELRHSYQPWDQTNYQIKGDVWITPQSLYRKENMFINGKPASSVLQYDQNTMLFSDYGSDTLSTVTKDEHSKQLYQSARYTPTLLLEYFYNRKTRLESNTDSIYNTYLEVINEARIRLFINKATDLVDKIDILKNDDFFGNINSTFEYRNYLSHQTLFIPKEILISKINGKLRDSISINSFKIENKLPVLLTAPLKYTLKESLHDNTSISLEKYNDHIYFLYLEHTDSKSLVVEFKNFLLVAEAPLNSKNGEMIINEIKKAFPDKPIKFFVFGHHHPHYLGGVRPFIHEGANILSSMGDFDYLTYLTRNSRTLKPDSLELDRKRLNVNILGESRTITDDNYSMQVINIGEDSHHTKDYIIFYFPKEKIIFEGDLVWIPSDGRVTDKVSSRQKGLYEAIQKLNLNVDTIFQSWPIKEFNYKSKISFRELEESVKE